MLKLIIGNRAYSSWSMRGWLAVRQSGEDFEELVVPMFEEALPALDGYGFSYHKFNRRAEDWPMVAVCALVSSCRLIS